MSEYLALLLPVAAASGWFAASRHYRRNSVDHSSGNQSSDSRYVKGLNYFLNDKPERALELLAEIIDRQSNPTESRIALGNLFRRTGEVERAIEFHQGLLSEPSLSEEQHAQTIFELGMDYMRAGLFDRAENIFQELESDRLYGQSAIQQLLQIYQHEKEWLKAIACARKLQSFGKLRRGETVSQFFCELADTAIKKNDLVQAQRYVADALKEEDRCIRANLLAAEIEIRQERFQEALSILQSIDPAHTKFVGQVAELMNACYQKLGDLSERIESLKKLHERSRGSELVPIISKLIQERDGVCAAQAFMLEEIRINPSLRDLDDLVGLLSIKPPENVKAMLCELRRITSKLLRDLPKYRCIQCGFSGLELHWRCPRCHHWETVVPLREDRGPPDTD